MSEMEPSVVLLNTFEEISLFSRRLKKSEFRLLLSLLLGHKDERPVYSPVFFLASEIRRSRPGTKRTDPTKVVYKYLKELENLGFPLKRENITLPVGEETDPTDEKTPNIIADIFGEEVQISEKHHPRDYYSVSPCQVVLDFPHHEFARKPESELETLQLDWTQQDTVDMAKFLSAVNHVRFISMVFSIRSGGIQLGRQVFQHEWLTHDLMDEILSAIPSGFIYQDYIYHGRALRETSMFTVGYNTKRKLKYRLDSSRVVIEFPQTTFSGLSAVFEDKLIAAE